MVVDLVDIKLQEDRSGDLDETGDFDTVTGNEYVKQRIVVAILDGGVTDVGDGLTANTIAELESDIEDFLRDEPYADPPIRATLTDVSDESIDLEVRTASDEFDFTV